MAGKKKILTDVEALRTVITVLTALNDKQRAWVIASASANLEIPTQTLIAPNAPASGAAAPAALIKTTVPGEPGTKEHAKAFVRSKNPVNVVQRIACLAYYLTHFQATPHFKTREITKMNSFAAGTSIGNPSQSVANATKQSKYLAPAGSGKKQLTAFGEEIVAALPDQAAVAALEKAEPARKKRKARKKKKAA